MAITIIVTIIIMPLSSSRNALLFLLALRLLNAACLTTFFQPDEFYQSLEPAWQLAFGSDAGAWITWVSWPLYCLPRIVLLTAMVSDRNGSTSFVPPYIPCSLRRSTMLQMLSHNPSVSLPRRVLVS